MNKRKPFSLFIVLLLLLAIFIWIATDDSHHYR